MTLDHMVYAIHYIVALVFIPNPNKYKFVMHKDGDISNNHVDNLVWSIGKIKIDETVFEELKGFSNYEISRSGIVRSIKTKIPLTHIISDGYPVVGIYEGKRNGIWKRPHVRIHCLLAIQFIPNPDNLPVVNHKDGNKGNFALDNLEWATSAENSQHARDIGLTAKKGKPYKMIEELGKDGNIIKTFSSIEDVVNDVGITRAVFRCEFRKNEKDDGTCIIKERIFRYKVESDLENEIWKNVRTGVKEFDKIYQASNLGRIRHITTKIIRKTNSTAGYLSVTLSSKGVKSRSITVHRLVAFAFLKGSLDLEVNHKNKIRTDNRLINLELLNKKDHMSKDQGKRVMRIKGDERTVYSSMAEAARCNSMTYIMVKRSVYHGKERDGYTWGFYDEDSDTEKLAEKKESTRGRKVVRIKDDERVIYPNMKDAAKQNSISYGMIKVSINNGKKRGEYTWEFHDEETNIKQPKVRGKGVVRIKGSESVTYPNMKEAAKCNSLSHAMIKVSINNGEKRGEYTWEFCDEKTTIKQPKIRGKGIVRIDGDERVTYFSINEAARCNSSSPHMIKKSIKNGKTEGGYNWEFCDKSNIERLNKKINDKEKRVVRVKGDERVLYPSIRKAADANPLLSHYTIGRAVKSGEQRGGYIWELYIEES